MLRRTSCRLLPPRRPPPPFHPLRRLQHSRHASPNAPHSRRTIGLFSGGALLAAALVSLADAPPPDPTTEMSLSELVRAYAVFTMCSFPSLVDNSPRLLQLATSLPVIGWFGERLVRCTFFDQVCSYLPPRDLISYLLSLIAQFVGGDTAEKTLPLLYKLRAVNKGALFAYSVEVDESEATGSPTRGEPSPSSSSSPHKRIVEEMIHCVDVAADFEDGVSGKRTSGRRTWVAIKMSALLPDANILIKFSSYLLATRPTRSIPYPGCPHASDLDVLRSNHPPPTGTLTPHDIAALRDFHADLVRICERAQARGVKIIVDAEYSWYQPAIDALTLSLTRHFNKLPPPPRDGDAGTPTSAAAAVQPLVTPALLAHSLADAKANNYALGVKLVRGAYHPYEVAAYTARLARAPSLLPPHADAEAHVWMEKKQTDDAYDACARMLVREIREDVRGRADARGAPGLGVLFGTHNWDSCGVILGELLRCGLATRAQARAGGGDGEKEGTGTGALVVPEDVVERVAIGQLYGMCDDLTNYLVNSTASDTPLIIKYVPYGALSEVMPYLSRRAIENKSVLGEGAATRERRRAGDAIVRRLLGSWAWW
ncbi:hypothetical protein C0992_010247 [Termitomyces sp. T32_za158]|nr:hypothetical protein C0992_010247 [Termitomyces sp. T32_za158]